MGLAGVRTAVSAFPSQNAAPLKLQFGGSACMLAVTVVPQALPAQALPQAPQFFASLARSASQPSSALWSQSPKPMAHEAMMQRDAWQPPLAWGSWQAWPHAPQFCASLVKSRHAELQQVVPTHAFAHPPQFALS